MAVTYFKEMSAQIAFS